MLLFKTDPISSPKRLTQSRWVINAFAAKKFIGLLCEEQWRKMNDESDVAWQNTTSYFAVSLALKLMKPAFMHTYDMGPHHSVHFGPLMVSWSPGWCEKCVRQ